MRRSPAAWACSGCARSLRTMPFAGCNPEAYAAVVERLKMLRERNQGLIDEIETALTTKLEEAKVDAARRRPREEALRHLEQDGAQADLARAAFRHLCLPHHRPEDARTATARSASCTRPGTPCPGRFKDYISNPEAERLSVDPHHHRRPAPSARRAANPHRAHAFDRRIWRRRACALQGSGSMAIGIVPTPDTNAYRWLRHLVGMLLDGDNPEEFLEHTKLELFQDQVFCFTPKGRLIALPRGANADRLCLCGAYRYRQYLRRRQDQRPSHAARHRAQERRRGRDHLLEGADAAVGLAKPRRHRQGALGHQARDPGCACAPNTASSAARSWCAPSSAAARSSARKRSFRPSGGCRRRPPTR